MKDLANLLVQLFSRNGDLSQVFLSTVHDKCLLCEEPISQTEAYLTERGCPFCRFTHTLSARQRIE